MSTWTKHLSEILKDELRRLKDGNKKEQQRYQNAEEAISAVLLNPGKDYGDLKYNLGKYRAAPVLAQYRLFYEIIDDEKVVHFVWMNDDDFIHDSSKKSDPCYERFKTLAQTNKIPKYEKRPPPGKPTINGFWKKTAQIYCSYPDRNGVANSTLVMQQEKKDSYRILDINATVEGVGLELGLLKWVTGLAQNEGVHLYHELDLRADPVKVEMLRTVFKKCGFQSLQDDDVELWEK